MPEPWTDILFHSWGDLLRVAVVGVLAYAGLIIILRISGKRTLAKMNAFDLVVTVSLGSILAATLLNKSISLTEGLTAYVVLILLQFMISFTTSRVPAFRRIVKAQPRLLCYEGQMLEDAMCKERVTPGEVLAKIRENGQNDIRDVKAVILETDGSLSVLSFPEHEIQEDHQSWRDVDGYQKL